MLSRKFFNPVPNRRFGVGILILSTSFVLTTVHNYFPLSGNRSLFRLHERSSPANGSFNAVYDFFVFERQRGVRHFAYTQSAAPTSFPGLFLVQNRLNSPKVTKKLLEVALWQKKLLKIIKVAEQNLDRPTTYITFALRSKMLCICHLPYFWLVLLLWFIYNLSCYI